MSSDQHNSDPQPEEQKEPLLVKSNNSAFLNTKDSQEVSREASFLNNLSNNNAKSANVSSAGTGIKSGPLAQAEDNLCIVEESPKSQR